MTLRNGWYRADTGKDFVLTQKGKDECASYRYKSVGEPVDEYDTEAVHWAVDSGYVVEVPIPDWEKRTEYRVVYDHKGYTINAGNGGQTFPTREIAERYMNHLYSRHWFDHECRIEPIKIEGRALIPMDIWEGNPVINKSYYCGCDCLIVGDYVSSEIVWDIIDAVPPTCVRDNCMQCGEPSDSIGNRYTYTTFKKVANDVYVYCGNCYSGENTEPQKRKEV